MDWINFLNTLVIFSIMFGVGSALTKRDFLRLYLHPRALGMGLILQMLFLPSLAFVIALFAPISAEYKVGLFILSLCPGGTASNFISYLVDADVALSVSLTTVNSFLILLTIPFFSQLGLNFFLESSSDFTLPIGETIQQVFLIILLPAALGYIFRQLRPSLAINTQYYFKWVNLALLAFVYGYKFFAGEDKGGSGINASDILEILPFALLLHMLSMFASRWISMTQKLENKASTTIAIEVGMQNTTLAMLICAGFIGSEEMSKPSLVTGIFAFFTTIAFAYYQLKWNQNGVQRHTSKGT